MKFLLIAAAALLVSHAARAESAPSPIEKEAMSLVDLSLNEGISLYRAEMAASKTTGVERRRLDGLLYAQGKADAKRVADAVKAKQAEGEKYWAAVNHVAESEHTGTSEVEYKILSNRADERAAPADLDGTL